MAKRKPQKPKSEVADYEQSLINTISKCQRVIYYLSKPEWQDVVSDHKKSAESLDMSWAYADSSDPKFRGMQAAKMAAIAVINMSASYEHDLNLATKNLEEYRNPKSVIKKDFDDEGITGVGTSKTESTAYHGQA